MRMILLHLGTPAGIYLLLVRTTLPMIMQNGRHVDLRHHINIMFGLKIGSVQEPHLYLGKVLNWTKLITYSLTLLESCLYHLVCSSLAHFLIAPLALIAVSTSGFW